MREWTDKEIVDGHLYSWWIYNKNGKPMVDSTCNHCGEKFTQICINNDLPIYCDSCVSQYVTNKTLKEFIEFQIGDITVERDWDKEGNLIYFVDGCLENGFEHGGYPYCAVELEAYGKTEKEALLNAAEIVIKEMKKLELQEQSFNKYAVELAKEDKND